MNTKEKALTHEALLDLLEYKESTGVFFWRRNINRRIRKGKIAGGPHGRNGYVIIHITLEDKSYKYRAHRLAFFYVNKRWPAAVIDHIDRDITNNRIENLRECTIQENTQWGYDARRGA